MSEEEEEKSKGIVVRTRIYEIVKGEGSNFLEEGKLQVSKDLFAELDDKVVEIVLAACKRAVDNGRKTVYPKDV